MFRLVAVGCSFFESRVSFLLVVQFLASVVGALVRRSSVLCLFLYFFFAPVVSAECLELVGGRSDRFLDLLTADAPLWAGEKIEIPTANQRKRLSYAGSTKL